MREQQIQQAILAALGARKDLRIWRANTGVAYGEDGRQVRFGAPGQGDLSGILRGGRRLELEVKAPGGRPTEQQARFGAMVNAMGGLWAVVRSVDEAVAVVEEALR